MYRAFILDENKTRVAQLSDVRWEINETLNAQDTIVLTTPEADRFSLLTAEKSFIRLIDDRTPTDIRTYRIQRLSQIHQDGQLGIRAEGDRIWQDMGRETYVNASNSPAGYHSFKSAVLGDLVTELMTASQFQAGATVAADTTEIEVLELSYTQILDALQQLADEAGLELDLDETTAPETVELITRGSDNGVVLHYGHNISGISRMIKREGIFNTIYPVGGGDPPATCAGALFEVGGVADPVLNVAGVKCIPANDTYIAAKIKFITGAEAGNSFTISDTVRGSAPGDDTITVSGGSIAAVSAGDLFQFTDGSGNDLEYVPNATSQATYGYWDGVVRDTSIEDVRTLIVPGFMDGTYTAGLQAGWSNVGSATVAENGDLAYIEHGSASQHVTCGAADKGISFAVPLDGSEQYSVAVRLYVASGSALVKVESAGTNPVTETNKTGTTGTGWFTVEIGGIPMEGAAATLSILSTGGAAEFYVDAVSFVGSRQPKGFVEFNSARELYRQAFDYLDDNAYPVIEYDIPGAIDLYDADPERWPLHQIQIGDTVRVIDPDLSLDVNVRVLSISKNERRETIRLKLATHTDLSAAFGSISPAIGAAVKAARKTRGIEEDLKAVQDKVTSITDRIFRLASTTALGRQFTGEIKATGQTSISISAGTLARNESTSYAIRAHTVSGLTADTVYYLYFDPANASSDFQTTTSLATAIVEDYVFVAILKTGDNANNRVRIFFDFQQTLGEQWVRGLEAYDDSDVLRVDVGEITDTINGGTLWGVYIPDGILEVRDAVGIINVISTSSIDGDGPQLNLYHNDTGGTVGVGSFAGTVSYSGNDDAGTPNRVVYALDIGYVQDASSGAEYGGRRFDLMINGALTEVFDLDAGGNLATLSLPLYTAAGVTFDGLTTVNGQIVQDITNTEAFLIRKDADGGDVFAVDTTNSIVTVGHLYFQGGSAYNIGEPLVRVAEYYGDNMTLVGTLRVDGGVDLGNAAGDKISLIGSVDTDIVPDAETRALGSADYPWQDLFIKTATGQISFVDASANEYADISIDASANLVLSNPTSSDYLTEVASAATSGIGATLQLYQSNTGAQNVGTLNFYGKDAGGTKQYYGSFYCFPYSRAAGSEQGRFIWDLIESGAVNNAMVLDWDGTLSVDASGGGSAAQVDLFDAFDDPAEVERLIKEPDKMTPRVRDSVTWQNGKGHVMWRIQPALRLIGGGLYQDHARIVALEKEVQELKRCAGVD
jgi:hypothetical protein